MITNRYRQQLRMRPSERKLDQQRTNLQLVLALVTERPGLRRSELVRDLERDERCTWAHPRQSLLSAIDSGALAKAGIRFEAEPYPGAGHRRPDYRFWSNAHDRA